MLLVWAKFESKYYLLDSMMLLIDLKIETNILEVFVGPNAAISFE